MRLEVRLFASLRKKLPSGSPRGKCELEMPERATFGDVCDRLTIPRESAQMVLINGEPDRDFDRALKDGDVVSVFPPLAGG